MNIKNFTLSRVEQCEGYTIGYLTSEDGRDWYEVQNLFDRDKLKIEYESTGLISRISMEISELWPLDKSVADIELKKVPKNINEKGMWLFDGENINSVPIDYIGLATLKRKELISLASQNIAILQDAVELGIDKHDEVHLLPAWKKYRVQLNRIDVSLAPDIQWPIQPSS
ncbi:tail fiber assembly protein [Dryocola sp. BD613]|uniref:tail fiber assembly protein n=1 Tax=Dryocola sp. BD613 TaxID=3133272 RepID=UPI003F4F48E9